MVFGVFDCFHAGHKSFLRQAKRHGKELVVVVARNKMVHHIKKKGPYHSEHARLKFVKAFRGVAKAVLGDEKPDVYGVVKKYRPDVVCFGYDQHTFKKSFRTWLKKRKMKHPALVTLKAHHPHRYKTSYVRPDGKI